MNILLMTPTWLLSERVMQNLSKVGTVTEPLGIAYLAAKVRENGFNVDILDCIAHDIQVNELESFLPRRDYDLVGITVQTPSFHRARENAVIIKKLMPNVFIVFGGPHINAMQKIDKISDVFHESSELDGAVYGEGEQTFLELAIAVRDKKKFEDIDGLIWRKSGGIVINKPRRFIEDLDKISFPAFDLLPLSKYKRTQSSYKRKPVRSLLTSRGCPFNCLFCDRGAFGSNVRRRSVGNVLAEIDILVNKFGAKELRFWDDVLTMDEKYLLELCKGLEKFNLSWSCNARVNALTPKSANGMRKAGCWEVDFGIEAGNDRVLKAINKRFTVAQASESFRIAREAGLEIRAFFILGLPEDDEKSLNDTIQFAIDSDLDYATFYMPQAYPGTQLYSMGIKEGSLADLEWSKFLIIGDEPTYINPVLGKDKIMEYHKTAYRRFYRRPKYILKCISKIRSMEDIRRFVSSASVLKI